MASPTKRQKQSRNGQPKKVNVLKSPVTIPQSVMPVFSDAMIVQYGGEAFTLSFLKILHPIDGDLKKLESRCVGQVIVTPSQMAENLKVLNGHFMTFASSQDEEVKKFLLEKANLKAPQ